MDTASCKQAVQACLERLNECAPALAMFDVAVTAGDERLSELWRPPAKRDAGSHQAMQRLQHSSSHHPPLYIVCRDSKKTSIYDAPLTAAHAPTATSSAPSPAINHAEKGGRAFFLSHEKTADGPSHSAPPSASPHIAAAATIHLVQDRLASAAEVQEALAHESVHAVDLLVHGLDLSFAGALACSEVRAAGLAECSPQALLQQKGQQQRKEQEQRGEEGASLITPSLRMSSSSSSPSSMAFRRKCIREKAWISTEMVFPAGLGGKAVDAVFNICLDSSPLQNPFEGCSWAVPMQRPQWRERVAAAGQGGESGQQHPALGQSGAASGSAASAGAAASAMSLKKT